tara:strand:+ start:145 stop:459 length:315 start_codon:yes stop_codon:yes gene_type:complete
MKGAITEPSVRIIRNPKRARKIMIGASHHFLRTFRKSQNSKSIDSFDTIYPNALKLFFIAFFFTYTLGTILPVCTVCFIPVQFYELLPEQPWNKSNRCKYHVIQ